MKKQLSQAALGAKLIRKHLKEKGIKARVTSSNYSMGSSINVEVYNQPPKAYDEIKQFCDHFQYGTFDAYTDCQGIAESYNEDGNAKYVHVYNKMSDEVYQKAWELIRNRINNLQNKQNTPEKFEDARKVYIEYFCEYADLLTSKIVYGSTGGCSSITEELWATL